MHFAFSMMSLIYFIVIHSYRQRCSRYNARLAMDQVKIIGVGRLDC